MDNMYQLLLKIQKLVWEVDNKFASVSRAPPVGWCQNAWDFESLLIELTTIDVIFDFH